MKCEVKTTKMGCGWAWVLWDRRLEVRGCGVVKHRKTALRQARRVAQRMGLEVGK